MSSACREQPLKAEIPDLLTLLQEQGHLKGVERPKARLKKASLAGVDLSNAKLVNADLSEADLSGANLSHADLTGATLTQAKLTGANLSHADLRKARLRGAVLDQADLSHAQLARATLSEVSAEGLTADQADFSDADLTKAVIKGGSFRASQFRRAVLSQSSFTQVDLTEALVEEAFLERTRLEDTRLQGADLTRANLVGLILVRPGDLDKTLFKEADLAEARLTEVDFRGADLSDAILDQMVLETVSFEGATLTRTDFQGVTGLTEAQLESIRAAGGIVNSLFFSKVFGYFKAHRWAQAVGVAVLLAAGGVGYFYLQNPTYQPVEDVLAQAHALRDSGKGDEALALYDMLLDRTKDRLDQQIAVLYDKADALSTMNRAKEAADVYARIAELTSNDRDEVINAQMRRAGALVESGDFEAAITIYKGIADDPTQSPKDAARALVALSQTYHQLGFEDRAMSLFEETLKKFPNDPEIALEVNLQMAEIYIQRKLYPQAENMLSQLDVLARDDSQKVALLISRARLYEEMGNREKSLATFETLIRQYPENPNVSPEVKIDLAGLMVEKGEYSWATRIYKDIIDRAEDPLLKSQAQLAYGVLLRTLGQYDKALELFRTVRRQATNNADLQGNSRLEEADTLVLLKRSDEALSLLDEAIRNAEAGIAGSALLRKAQLLQDLGRMDEAAATYQQVSSGFKASGETASEMQVMARLELARLEASRSNFTAAIPLLEQLLRDPAAVTLKSHILDQLGQCQLDSGNKEAAQKTFEQLQAIPGDSEALANARFGMARLAVANGDRAKAIALYQDTAREVDDLALKVSALDSLARLYQDAGDAASALSTFQQILATVPPRHDAAFAASQAMADIYSARKDYAKAESLYLSVLSNAEKGEVRAGVQLALGRLYLDMKQVDKATAAFKEIVEKYPGEAESAFGARLELARLQQSAGKSEAAISALKALIAETKDAKLNVQAVEVLSGIYQDTGRADEALKLSQQLLAQTSDDAEARFNAEMNVASSLRQKGELKGALEKYLKLKETPDLTLKVNVLDGLGQTYMAMNDAPKAAEAYQEIMTRAKDNQDIVENAMMGLAGAYRQMNRGKDAAALYEKLIKETPDTGMKSWAQESLAQTYAEIGQGDKAKAVVAQSAASTDPAQGLNQANLLRSTGDTAGALKRYEEISANAAADKGDRAWAMVYAGQLLADQEKGDDALERFMKVSEQFSTEAEQVLNAKLGMAGVLRARNRLKEAAARYEDASRGESFADYRINAAISAADLYLELSQKDKARELYDGLLKRFPDKPEAVYGAKLGLASVLKASGKMQEAATAFEAVEATAPDNSTKAAALAGAARCYAELSQKDKARAAFTRLKTRYADQTELVNEANTFLAQP